MNLGHYQTHAIWITALGAAALLATLLLPYAINTADDGDGRVITRSEFRDYERGRASIGDGNGMGSTGVTLAGAIVLLVTGAVLLVLGQVAMPVEAARWVGWAGGMAGLLGVLLAATSSLLLVGYLFSSLLELGVEHENAAFDGNVYIPLAALVVASVATLAFVRCLELMRSVVSIADGRRDLAGLKHRWALLAYAFLALVLTVPWSLHNPPGGMYDWLNADGILSSNRASQGGFAGAQASEAWGGMAYALRVMMVTGWVGVFAGAVGGAHYLLPSGQALSRAQVLPRVALAAMVFMLAWTSILYILSWTYMWRPVSGADDYQPGYFPILVLAALGPWIMTCLHAVRQQLAGAGLGRGGGASGQPLRFD